MEVTPYFIMMASIITVIIAIFTFDDLFIDFYAWISGVKPKAVTSEFLKNQPEKLIAIMVANWHEDEILYQMINGNNKCIKYSEHHFFLGVYPNDTATLDVAHRLASENKNVHMVINPKDGPTSKGQMINTIVDTVLSLEDSENLRFELFVIHDSEDIIHPLSMQLFNVSSSEHDFIQIPIFSLNRDRWQLTAGSYMDEFAEMHTKELLVRNAIGSAIPSAGVGTCLKRELVIFIKQLNNDHFLIPQSLTEDYILGWQAHFNKFRCAFLCCVVDGKEIIATKEYFPQGFYQSIKQKTRWTIGIAFQGRKLLGWTTSLADNYFLFRDRRGPLNSVVTLASLILLILSFFETNLTLHSFHPVILAAAALNLSGLIIRIYQRTYFHGVVYKKYPLAFIILRWPVAITINAAAASRAFYQYNLSIIGLKKLNWSKTQHTLPEEFGQST